MAAAEGYVTVIKTLLELKASVNAKVHACTCVVLVLPASGIGFARKENGPSRDTVASACTCIVYSSVHVCTAVCVQTWTHPGRVIYMYSTCACTIIC